MTLLTLAEAKSLISTSLSDDAVEFLIKSAETDVLRVSGSRLPLNQVQGQYIHYVLTVASIASDTITFTVGQNLGGGNPNMVSVSATISTAVLTSVFRIIRFDYGYGYYIWGRRLTTWYNWSLAFGDNLLVYYPDEVTDESSEEGKLCTVTAEHDISSFTTTSATALGTLAVGDEVHLIVSREAPSYHMPVSEYTDRQKQIVLDLLRILVVDDGTMGSQTRVEGLMDKQVMYADTNKQYAKRLKQAVYLRGPL